MKPVLGHGGPCHSVERGLVTLPIPLVILWGGFVGFQDLPSGSHWSRERILSSSVRPGFLKDHPEFCPETLLEELTCRLCSAGVDRTKSGLMEHGVSKSIVLSE